jgi:hypothetical protein
MIGGANPQAAGTATACRGRMRIRRRCCEKAAISR